MLKRSMLFVVCVCLFLCEPVWGWSYHTHRKIAADAMRLMPENIRTELYGTKKELLKGSTDPDTLIKDFYNHAYHSDGTHNNGLVRIKEVMARLISELKDKKPAKEIAYTMGLLAHYVSDLNQPLHTAGASRDRNEKKYHLTYEHDLNPVLNELTLPNITYEPPADIDARVQLMTSEANKHYESISKAYTGGSGFAEVKEMSFAQVAESVKQVVDFWLAAFIAAGRLTLPAAPTASSAPTVPAAQP